MPSVGAVTSNLTIVGRSSSVTVNANEFAVVDATTAAWTITLPLTPQINTLVAVKKSDSSTNAVTVVPNTGANINGDTACILAIQGAGATFQYDGTNWQMLSAGNINTANPAAGIPSGGLAGEVLKKNSTTSYDVAWGSAGGGGMLWPWTAGRVHTAPVGWGQCSLNPSPTTNMMFWPIRIPNACTISQMGVYTVGAVTLYIGLYADAGPSVTSQGPGTRLTGASGTTSTNTLNWVSTPYTFTGATNCWVGYSVSATFNVWAQQGQFTNVLPVSSANASTFVQQGFCYRYTATATNGSVPATTDFSGVALSTAGGQTTNYPVIFFNVTA